MTNQYNTPADVFFDEILQAHHQIVLVKDRYPRFRTILENACKDLTKNESIHFSNLFSRLAYLTQREKFSYQETRQAHLVRKRANDVLHKDYTPSEEEYQQDIEAISRTIARLYNLPLPSVLVTVFPAQNALVKPTVLKKVSRSRHPKMRVQILDKEGDILVCQWSAQEDEPIRVLVNVDGYNDLFRETVRLCWKGAQLNLLDVEYLPEVNAFQPQYIILEPDYLVDVTAIATCFTNYAETPLFNLCGKFQATENTIPLMLGNLANHMLDRLLHQQEPRPSVKDLLTESFRNNPLVYTTCKDLEDDTKSSEFMNNVNLHYKNILIAILEQFSEEQIYPNHVVLEPSFMSETYGLQGRLDLFQPPVGTVSAKIIELKAGSARGKPNQLSTEHLAQTTLYRLMLQSAFMYKPQDIIPAIFYSKLSRLEQNLRYAPYLITEEKQFLNMRNQLVAMEYEIARDKTFTFLKTNLDNLSPQEWQKQWTRTPNFQVDKLKAVYNTIASGSTVEKQYFLEYVRFIAEEHLLSKIGDPTYGSNREQASLWSSSFLEKKETSDILYDLTIDDNRIAETEKTIRFKRSADAPVSVNFRVGDICAVYPFTNGKYEIVSNQVLKGTIAALTNTHVTVVFRYQQRNKQFFGRYTYWALEHDTLEKSYTAQYQSLMQFMGAHPDRRALLLGQRSPQVDLAIQYQNENLRPEQSKLVQKALAAKDYFLLVGPPGTGKTSIMLRTIIDVLHSNPQQNILITAYTNRAVDEICEAIEHLPFLRIGSSGSCDTRFQDRLLDTVASTCPTRQALKTRLQDVRIYVATVASLATKGDLLQFKSFDVVIVDEASQILEPQIIGLLAQIPKFILIGDHKQLPAIVLQSQKRAETVSDELKEIGLESLKNSLFERLLMQAQQKNWDWAYGMLTDQGRMHEEIAWFANHYFYDDSLNTVKPVQIAPITNRYTTYDPNSPLETLLATRRLAFIPSYIHTDDSPGAKCNTFEAELVVCMIQKIIALYAKNGLSFDPEKSVGVITPYRNQIAMIKLKLEEAGISGHENICVDTVERYQGGQRDIIIYSFSVNSRRQVDMLPNLSDDSRVDRKLNVAVTRAKEQLIFTGQSQLLNSQLLFKHLSEWIIDSGGYVQEGVEAVLKDTFTIPEKADVSVIKPVYDFEFDTEIPI